MSQVCTCVCVCLHQHEGQSDLDPRVPKQAPKATPEPAADPRASAGKAAASVRISSGLQLTGQRAAPLLFAAAGFVLTQFSTQVGFNVTHQLTCPSNVSRFFSPRLIGVLQGLCAAQLLGHFFAYVGV